MARRFLVSGTQVPAELMKPLARIRVDSELPLPAVDQKIARVLSRLPRLPFEGKIVALLRGDIEQALPKMPWET